MNNKKRILLIDDEKSFTEVLKLNLTDKGDYLVFVENDPEMAVKTALAFRPDLVLMDIIMPKLEGPDVVVQFRENLELKDIPIIFLTATITPQEIEYSQDGHIAGHVFVSKPTEIELLIAAIERELA